MPAVKSYLNCINRPPRVSSQWAESSVGKVLDNQICLGKVKQGRSEWTDESLRIISDKEFQACQVQRMARKKYSPKLKELPKDYAEGSFCPHCGRHCLEDMVYCPGCGVIVSEGKIMSAHTL